ncbi:uncharacterized protein LOC142817763 isoform X2 [Rhipicephalus microplus]|uniref:uncharacterized protein LOC142817763 isoform X2 n=1 Tax=Rhipicephalus microplus TaxID=6941 RepID=UPI003F6CF46F
MKKGPSCVCGCFGFYRFLANVQEWAGAIMLKEQRKQNKAARGTLYLQRGATEEEEEACRSLCSEGRRCELSPKKKPPRDSRHVPRFLEGGHWRRCSLSVGVDKSNYIKLGLAGISIIFDACILVGTVQYIPELLDSGCIWHYVDLGADFIIGMASANYTRPQIIVRKTEVTHVNIRGSDRAGATSCIETTSAPNATDFVEDGGTRPHGVNDTNRGTASTEREDDQALLMKEHSVHPLVMRLFRARATGHMYQTKEEKTTVRVLMQPETVRQFLHFSYVILRAAAKFQTLGMLGSLGHMMKREHN